MLISSEGQKKPFFKQMALRCYRFLSQLLKSIWVFFPGVLFLIFPVFCFWMLGQGQDIMVAFVNNNLSANKIFSFNYFRIIFFVAIGFWVYVSWYSSRIIAYIKKKQQLDALTKAGVDPQTAESDFTDQKIPFDIGPDFLEEIPRIIGNGCFLILELAVLQLPVLNHRLNVPEACILFLLSLIILTYVNKWISGRQDGHMALRNEKAMAERKIFRDIFRVLLVVFIVIAIATSSFNVTGGSIWILFGLLLLFHVIFIFYVNLRRVEMEKNALVAKEDAQREVKRKRGLLKRSMDYFCIPRMEIGYYRAFLCICAAGIFFYFLAICSLWFARKLGPFPFLILAFGVLLAYGNFVTAFSVRYKINFHFLLFLLALALGLGETHEVRTISPGSHTNNYDARPNLKTYLTAWLANKKMSPDSCYDMYFIMSNGGASRSGYWTAAVLGKIEDSSLVKDTANRFSDHIFCLSGTSGGGVGVATFFSLLRNKALHTQPRYAASARAFLKQDYFSFTFARMLGPDFFNYIFHLNNLVNIDVTKDRAAALESSFETSAGQQEDTSATYPVPFADPLSAFPAMTGITLNLPVLFVNTTRMQDGNPGVVTNLRISADTNVFNGRIDVVSLLDSDKDISITSGAILGARFPYLSPAGRIKNDYFVDGGYFDNSGAGVVQEIIRGILNIAKEDTAGELAQKIKRLNFQVLHIVNSPVSSGSAKMESVAPIKNDVMSPVLTIVGAYDMQTTVNDGRLRNYLTDIQNHESNRASYTQVSLYKTPEEWKADTSKPCCGLPPHSEPPYAMNWFMSDTTISRINKRLGSNDVLNGLIKNFGKTAGFKK